MPLWRNPTTGIVDCCARAASGHTAAAAPSAAMNSRRQRAIGDRQPHRQHDQATIGLACECRYGALDFGGIAWIDGADLYPERRSHGLECG